MASQMSVTFVNIFLCPKWKSFPKVHFGSRNPKFSGKILQKSNSNILKFGPSYTESMYGAEFERNWSEIK